MTEHVIAGGGLAGSAAAAILARAGERVLVLERTAGPHDKICGEFLSTETQARLEAIGLDARSLGASELRGVRLIAGRRSAEAPLPFKALGLSRRRLDEALLVHAERLGARIERGVCVRSIAEDGLQTSGGSLRASTVLLASGKHDIRGARRGGHGALKETIGGMIGFKTYFRLSPKARAAMQGCIEVVLFEGGYAGLQLVEGGLANLCLLVSRKRFEAAGRSWPSLLEELLREPHLARRLADAEETLPRPLTITDVPFGLVHSGDGGPRALFRLGDQAAVTPSFSGEGMSIALHSAELAARAILEGGDARAYHARLRAQVAPQVRRAVWLQRRVETWPGRDAVVLGLSLMPWALRGLASWTRVCARPTAPSPAAGTSASVPGPRHRPAVPSCP